SYFRPSPPPPPSALLPYTTLFRSRKVGRPQSPLSDFGEGAFPDPERDPLCENKSPEWKSRPSSTASCFHICCLCRSSSLHSYSSDRKSTRLNSSHDQISYAVFCLK